MIDKLYYTIAEVSEELNLPQPTLRFWETEFKQLKPRRNPRGSRCYTKQDVDFIKQVVYLTDDCGYTLEGAKKQLLNRKASHLEAESELAANLKELRDFLLDIKKGLKTESENS